MWDPNLFLQIRKLRTVRSTQAPLLAGLPLVPHQSSLLIRSKSQSPSCHGTMVQPFPRRVPKRDGWIHVFGWLSKSTMRLEQPVNQKKHLSTLLHLSVWSHNSLIKTKLCDTTCGNTRLNWMGHDVSDNFSCLPTILSSCFSVDLSKAP